MPIRIVSYSMRRGAYLPEALTRCINARTNDFCWRVWASEHGETALRFEGDRQWTSKAKLVETELLEADVVIVHDGKVAPSHRELLTGKPVVTLAEDWLNVDQTYVQQDLPGVVLGQHHAILPRFRNWKVVPLPIPLWEDCYRPAQRGKTLTLCYAPPRCVGSYSSSHRLHWHSKGYRAAMRVLNRLAAESGVRLEIIKTGWSSPSASLELKRQSHVVIDECVTGSYHRESLEGAAVGAVVINGLGLQPAIEKVFRYCAQGEDSSPFLCAHRGSLGHLLASIVKKGTEQLTADGAANRLWMEDHWDFGKQWILFWRPVLLDAIASRGSRRSSVPRILTATSPSTTKPEVSVVVISHNEGLYLRRTVSSLMRTLPPRSEVVVVDDQSNDGSTEGLQDYDRVIVVQAPQRLGVSSARNFGASHCGGRVLVFSDAHVEVPDYWSQRLTEVLERKEVGAVGPAINNLKLRTGGGKCGGTWRWDDEASLSWRWLERLAPHPYPVPLLCGCFMAMRRDVFEVAAGFDSGMIQYGIEDSELSLRLWALGYECWVVPDVIVAHRFGSFGSRSRTGYKFRSDIFLHNELRLAVVHFGQERIQRLLGRQVQNEAFPEAFCRLAASDVWKRRGEVRDIRRNDDDWFFRRFSSS